jgi:hypothetical protein
MTAKDYYKSTWHIYTIEWTEEMVFNFAEGYHREKMKELSTQQCPNCEKEVEMISNGQICPECWCVS